MAYGVYVDASDERRCSARRYLARYVKQWQIGTPAFMTGLFRLIQCPRTQAHPCTTKRTYTHQGPNNCYNSLLLRTLMCRRQLLWPPNRAGHHILQLWFLSSFFFFFYPRLFSAVADGMSTILPHMVWLYCEFRMHVWNVVHAARWKCRTQKNRQKLPSGHHRTTLSGCIFATTACIDNQKKTC